MDWVEKRKQVKQFIEEVVYHLEKGFDVTDCVEIRENCIEYDVQFKQASVEKLMGRTVRLYIVAQDANLYGFRFK